MPPITQSWVVKAADVSAISVLGTSAPLVHDLLTSSKDKENLALAKEIFGDEIVQRPVRKRKAARKSYRRRTSRTLTRRKVARRQH